MTQENSYKNAEYCLNKSIVILKTNGEKMWNANSAVFNAETCENLKVSKGQYRCCYMEISYDSDDFYSGCHEVTKVHYHELEEWYDEIEEGKDSFFGGLTKDYDMEFFDCNGKFLQFSSLVFMALIMILD